MFQAEGTGGDPETDRAAQEPAESRGLLDVGERGRCEQLESEELSLCLSSQLCGPKLTGLAYLIQKINSKLLQGF